MPTISDEINKVPQNVIHSFTHAKDTVVTLPVKLLQFFSEVGVFLIVLLVLIWIGTGWRVTVGLKKSAISVSGFADGGGTRENGMPGNFGGNIGIFDGAGLQRRSARSDIISLGWSIEDSPDGFGVEGNRREGFQRNMDNQLGTGAVAGFGNREPPIFQEVSVDTLRSEDQERAAVAALAKINQARVSRRPEMEYDPLPWKPFWNEWKKENTDIYSGYSNEYKGPSAVYNADFLNR